MASNPEPTRQRNYGPLPRTNRVGESGVVWWEIVFVVGFVWALLIVLILRILHHV